MWLVNTHDLIEDCLVSDAEYMLLWKLQIKWGDGMTNLKESKGFIMMNISMQFASKAWRQKLLFQGRLMKLPSLLNLWERDLLVDHSWVGLGMQVSTEEGRAANGEFAKHMWNHRHAQLRLTLLRPHARYSPLRGTSQAKLLEWFANSSSRETSQPRDRNHVSLVSCIDRKILYQWATWEAQNHRHKWQGLGQCRKFKVVSGWRVVERHSSKTL